MYRFNQAACTDKFVHTVHTLALWAANANRWPFSVVPTEAHAEKVAASWNPPFAYNGD